MWRCLKRLCFWHFAELHGTSCGTVPISRSLGPWKFEKKKRNIRCVTPPWASCHLQHHWESSPWPPWSTISKFRKSDWKWQRTCKICLKWRQRHRFRVNQKYKLQKLHKYIDQWPLTMTRDLPRIVTCRPHHNAWLWHITASVWIKLDTMVVTAAEIHGLSRWRCSLLAASPRKILIFCGNGCSSTPSDPNQNTEPIWDCTRSLHHHMNLSAFQASRCDVVPARVAGARRGCWRWISGCRQGTELCPTLALRRYVKVEGRMLRMER